MAQNRVCPVGVQPRLVADVERAIPVMRVDLRVNYGKGRTPAPLAPFGIPASYATPGAAKVT